MLTQDEALEIYRRRGAYLKGHFKLSSGLHSEYYLQSALVLQYPQDAEVLCGSIAEHFSGVDVDVVVAPAMGGIIVSYEVARSLGVRSVFAERVDGRLTLRRGFAIAPHEKVLVVEDVVTTGKSIAETIDIVKEYSEHIVGVGALVDRAGEFKPPYEYFPLIRLKIKNYTEEECPLCRQGVPIEKPGSRFSNPKPADR